MLNRVKKTSLLHSCTVKFGCFKGSCILLPNNIFIEHQTYWIHAVGEDAVWEAVLHR